jgi:hypothetical protein
MLMAASFSSDNQDQELVSNAETKQEFTPMQDITDMCVKE